MWKKAFDNKKLRLNYSDQIQITNDLKVKLISLIWDEIRKLNTKEPDVSQDETINFNLMEREGSKTKIYFSYIFDFDFSSQYDKTESLYGEIIIDNYTGIINTRWM